MQTTTPPPQNADELQRRIEVLVSDTIPRGPCSTHSECIGMWERVSSALSDCYSQLQRYYRRLAARHNLPLPAVPFSFTTPDVIRAELFQDSTVDPLKDAIDAASTMQCSLLANRVTSELLTPLSQSGCIGSLERFNSACRVTIVTAAGDKVTADLVMLMKDEAGRGLSRSDRSLLRTTPTFLLPLCVAYIGKCVRLVDGNDQPQPLPSRAVSVLTLGPHVLAMSPHALAHRSIPKLGVPKLSLPSAGTLRPYLVGTAIAAVLAIAIVVSVFKHTLILSAAGIAIVASLLLLLRKEATNATP